MDFLNWVAVNSDFAVAITAIASIFISITALVATIVFSLLQNIHNRNSVRPLCSIIAKDFKNCLSVRIESNGAGPLTIISFKCSKPLKNSETLIELLPEVGQDYETFVRRLTGRTMSAGAQIKLFEIIPQNDEIRAKLRTALKDIKIHMVYADIYKKKFVCEKYLDFFNRDDGNTARESAK